MIEKVSPDFISETPLSIDFLNIRHTKPHMHPSSIEFLYCLSGEAGFIIDHESERIRFGELVTIEPESMHCLWAEEDNLFLSVQIDLKNTPYEYEQIKYYYFSCATGLCLSHQKKALEKIIELLLSAAYLYVSKDNVSRQQLTDISNSIITVLVEHFCWFSIEELTSKENEKFKERLNNILAYTQIHFKEKVTLKKISQMEYINESYLSQFLKRTSFHSFTLMLNYIRCFESQKLLLCTDLPISVISDECGFSSKKYFHRYFKYYWKTTPLQFKKKYENYAKEPERVYPAALDEMKDFIKDFIAEYFLKSALENK